MSDEIPNEITERDSSFWERQRREAPTNNGDVHDMNVVDILQTIDNALNVTIGARSTIHPTRLKKIRAHIANQAAELSLKDKRIEELENACEIAIGYTSMVAHGLKKIPILKDRAKSDTEIITKALKGGE